MSLLVYNNWVGNVLVVLECINGTAPEYLSKKFYTRSSVSDREMRKRHSHFQDKLCKTYILTLTSSARQGLQDLYFDMIYILTLFVFIITPISIDCRWLRKTTSSERASKPESGTDLITDYIFSRVV